MDSRFDWMNDSSTREKVFAEYRRIRDAMLAKCVSDARNALFFRNVDMVRVAQSIGIDTSFDRKTRKPCIDFDDQQQLDILLDYAMMFDCTDGRPLRYEFIRRYSQSKSEELRIISKVYSDYAYAWLRPIRSEAGFGAHCVDMISGREVILVDKGLSHTLAEDPWQGIATGIHPFGDPALGCVMTGGAGLPFPLLETATVLEEMLIDLKIDKRPPMVFSDDEASRFVACFLRAAMRNNLSEHVRYE